MHTVKSCDNLLTRDCMARPSSQSVAFSETPEDIRVPGSYGVTFADIDNSVTEDFDLRVAFAVPDAGSLLARRGSKRRPSPATSKFPLPRLHLFALTHDTLPLFQETSSFT